jgi:ABC-type multidrug transport system permease subunit
LIALAIYDFRPDPMDALVGPIFHVSIILGIFYAWTVGFNRTSKFRPGKARNMKEEFIVYGLPFWFMYSVGAIKLILSALLIAGFFILSCSNPHPRLSAWSWQEPCSCI